MTTSRRAIGEMAAAALTAAAFQVFEALCDARLLFILPYVTLWSVYIAARVLRERAVLRDWGLRLDNLRVAALPCLSR